MLFGASHIQGHNAYEDVNNEERLQKVGLKVIFHVYVGFTSSYICMYVERLMHVFFLILTIE